jgi:hypothetical protein
MRILYVQHELGLWASARQWSYTTHLAYVDGLRAQGHEVLVLLTSLWPWARQIVGDHRFDQVWINDVIHATGTREATRQRLCLSDEAFAWFATLAPVRVGILMETLYYTPQDYAELPQLARRVPLLKATVLPFITHLCVVDENDVRHIENLGVQALWTPCHVPAAYFRPSLVQTDARAAFIGTLYAKRAKYAQHPRLQALLEFRTSGEYRNGLPDIFDQLNGPVRMGLLQQPCTQARAHEFTKTQHELRGMLFEGFLDGLGDALATVNLPSFVKTYAGRVIESMAVGQPVVSWRIPDRPQNARLFVEDDSILFFDDDHPDALADVLQRLRTEPGLPERLGARGRANALKHHTTEHRVGQIQQWIACGTTPQLWD